MINRLIQWNGLMNRCVPKSFYIFSKPNSPHTYALFQEPNHGKRQRRQPDRLELGNQDGFPEKKPKRNPAHAPSGASDTQVTEENSDADETLSDIDGIRLGNHNINM
jgi:hypothetical protein